MASTSFFTFRFLNSMNFPSRSTLELRELRSTQDLRASSQTNNPYGAYTTTDSALPHFQEETSISLIDDPDDTITALPSPGENTGSAILSMQLDEQVVAPGNKRAEVLSGMKKSVKKVKTACVIALRQLADEQVIAPGSKRAVLLSGIKQSVKKMKAACVITLRQLSDEQAIAPGSKRAAVLGGMEKSVNKVKAACIITLRQLADEQVFAPGNKRASVLSGMKKSVKKAKAGFRHVKFKRTRRPIAQPTNFMHVGGPESDDNMPYHRGHDRSGGQCVNYE